MCPRIVIQSAAEAAAPAVTAGSLAAHSAQLLSIPGGGPPGSPARPPCQRSQRRLIKQRQAVCEEELLDLA